MPLATIKSEFSFRYFCHRQVFPVLRYNEFVFVLSHGDVITHRKLTSTETLSFSCIHIISWNSFFFKPQQEQVFEHLFILATQPMSTMTLNMPLDLRVTELHGSTWQPSCVHHTACSASSSLVDKGVMDAPAWSLVWEVQGDSYGLRAFNTQNMWAGRFK